MSTEMRLRSLPPLLVVMLLMASQGLGAMSDGSADRIGSIESGLCGFRTDGCLLVQQPETVGHGSGSLNCHRGGGPDLKNEWESTAD